MDSKKKRKYLLFKKDDATAGPKPCAFFISAEGCRNGASCPFGHNVGSTTSIPRDNNGAKDTNKPLNEHSNQVNILPQERDRVEPRTDNDVRKVKSKKLKEDESLKVESEIATPKTLKRKKKEPELAVPSSIPAQVALQHTNSYQENNLNQHQLQQSLYTERQSYQQISHQRKEERDDNNDDDDDDYQEEDAEDTAFLFGAVNQVLIDGRTQQQQQQQLQQQQQQQQQLLQQQQEQQQQQKLQQHQLQQQQQQLQQQKQQQLQQQQKPSSIPLHQTTYQPHYLNLSPSNPASNSSFNYADLPFAPPPGLTQSHQYPVAAAATIPPTKMNVPVYSQPIPIAPALPQHIAPTIGNVRAKQETRRNSLSNPVPAATSTATSPFVAGNDVHRLLQTSGTTHATLGPTVVKQKAAKKLVVPPPQAFVVPVSQPAMVPPQYAGMPASHQIQTNGSSGSSNITGTYPTYNAYSKSSATPLVPQLQPQLQPIIRNTTPAPPATATAKRTWSDLLAITQNHKKYEKDFTFFIDYTWLTSKPYGDWAVHLPPVLGIDCEMCETTDPVTGAVDGNTLIRLSIINAMNPAEVILDTLVSPSMPVTNLRTSIHGITEEALKDVKFTFRHAQAAIYNLCSDRTILVGHAVYNDLKSLHFQHQNAVDTSYLYVIAGESKAAPSLRDIYQHIHGVSLLATHDSVEDARASVNIASHIMTYQPSVGSGSGAGAAYQPVEVPRLTGNISSSRDKDSEDKETLPLSLLVHRIPHDMVEEQITQMFTGTTYVCPVKINPITREENAKIVTSSSGKAVPNGRSIVLFSSASHADLAFDTISGPNRPDNANRSQKRVYLKGGGYLCVRKC